MPKPSRWRDLFDYALGILLGIGLSVTVIAIMLNYYFWVILKP